MRRRKRNFWILGFGLLGFGLLAWLINSYPPSSWQLVALFFLLFFISSLFVSLYLLHNVRRAILFSFSLTIFFVLRALNLRQLIYPILLTASFISLELLFNKR